MAEETAVTLPVSINAGIQLTCPTRASPPTANPRPKNRVNSLSALDFRSASSPNSDSVSSSLRTVRRRRRGSLILLIPRASTRQPLPKTTQPPEPSIAPVTRNGSPETTHTVIWPLLTSSPDLSSADDGGGSGRPYLRMVLARRTSA